MQTNYKYILITWLLLIISTACTQEDAFKTADGRPVEIVATIGDAPMDTKATERGDDKISYASFTSGDKVGFFAEGGLKAENVELTYSDGSFLSDGNSLQWYDGDATHIVSYYPYSSDLSTVNIHRVKDLNSNKWNEGFNDFLIAKNGSVGNGTLVGLSYKHAFSMLIIKRREGFDSNDSDIKVTLNAKVSKEGIFSKDGVLTLKKDEQDGVQELTANKGTYVEDQTSVDCWYVIIPVGAYENETGVSCNTQSITLTNNAGVPITIPYSRKYESNWKYLVTAKMRNDQAIIETEEIRIWDQDSIKIEMPAGISTYDEFSKWLAAYNAYRKNENTDANGDILSTFGTQKQGSKNWTFRLLEDITIDPGEWGNDKSVVITTFDKDDEFDGQGHTITGIKLNSSSSDCGFFGTLNGKISNLRLKHISIDGKENTGAIAGTVGSGASITNCHVEGASYILGTNNVGGIAGYNGGTVDKCSSSALVKGDSNKGVIVGAGTSTNDGISTGKVL